MKDISVEELAKIVGTPEEKILSQMKEAGLNQTLASDLVTVSYTHLTLPTNREV